MKKSLTALFFCAAASAFGANAGTDANNPTLMSSWTEWNGGTSTVNSIIWRGENGATSTNLVDCYVSVDNNFSMTQFTVSGGGGNHSNMNMIFDNTSLTFASGVPFYFNNTTTSTGITTNYSLGFYFTAKEGSTGTVNFTKALTIDLFSQDITTGGVSLSKYGRVISIGNGITANASDNFSISGRNPELTVSDSKFEVAGTFNVAGIFSATNTNLDIASTGVLKSDTINIYGTSLNIQGAVKSAAGGDGTITFSTGASDLSAGATNLATTAIQATGSAQLAINNSMTVKSYNSLSADTNMSIGKNVTLTVGNTRKFIFLLKI